MARTQTIVQFTDELLSALDQEVVVSGRSRSELIRDAVEAYLGQRAEAQADRELIEAYTRIPQTESPTAEQDVRELIEEEPW